MHLPSTRDTSSTSRVVAACLTVKCSCGASRGSHLCTISQVLDSRASATRERRKECASQQIFFTTSNVFSCSVAHHDDTLMATSLAYCEHCCYKRSLDWARKHYLYFWQRDLGQWRETTSTKAVKRPQHDPGVALGESCARLGLRCSNCKLMFPLCFVCLLQVGLLLRSAG